MAKVVELRLQLRWAWAKMGCRCIFDRRHIRKFTDNHCPVHGIYISGERGRWIDPFGNNGPLDQEVML